MESTETEKVEEVWFGFYESFKELFEFFCDNTTIHGTIRLNCSRRNKMKTGFWVVLFFCSFGMMYWQFGDTVHQYWSYPTNIAIVLQSNKMPFPAVTVCNLNPYRFGQVNEYLNQLDHLAEETLRTLYGYNASLPLNKDTEIVDLQDIMNNMTIKEDENFHLDKTITLAKINTEDGRQTATGRRQKVGFKLCDSSGKDCYYRSFWSALDAFHEWYKFHFMNIMSEIPLVLQVPEKWIKKFILNCDFNGVLCNSNYSHFHHPTYGACLTINENFWIDSKYWTSVHSTKVYGLSLTLKTDQNDNMPMLSTAAGAKVIIHNPNQSPLAELQGFDIWPGTKTSISVREDQVNRLGAPYSECTFDGSDLDFQLLYNSSYTQQSCLPSCFQHKMIKTCGCGYYFYPLPPGMEYCDYNKHPGWGHCFYQLYEKLLDHRLICFEKCPKQCRETMYELSVGSAKWPTSVSKGWITTGLSINGYNRTSKRNDIAKLNIYFQELSLRSFEETPAINVESLLSTMGSQWSFWFGSSVLSVAELAELVFDVAAMLIIIGYRKFGKKKEGNKNMDLYVIETDGLSDVDGRTVTTSEVHEKPNYSEAKIDS